MSAPMTEVAARKMPCPLARAYAPGALADGNCCAGKCPVWRWRPLMVDDPGYQTAIRKAENEGMKPAVAAKYVHEHREVLGLPTTPYLGWCGLGGGPTL